jgi:NCAIR mutase (PurE)-related protein
LDEQTLRRLLKGVKSEEISIDEGIQRLKVLPFEELGFATIDHHRQIRQGFPEVIYCAGKTREQIIEIVRKLSDNNEENNILMTRAEADIYAAVAKAIPEAVYVALARLIVIYRGEQKRRGHILVISAGTADIPVAEEAAMTAEVMGNKVERLYDVGVAGIHRILSKTDKLRQARVMVVAAGMEGALASVVGGLTDRPVIALPTSVGYGASFGGLAALLAMLNSCASGIGVVNIDNGFGAGFLANNINRLGLEEAEA